MTSQHSISRFICLKLCSLFSGEFSMGVGLQLYDKFINRVFLLFQIQQNKQVVSSLKRKHSDSLEDLRPSSDNSSRINSRWTNEELLLAVQGVRKYGKDFKSIAEVLGNKTEHHVRSFFVNYRKRYNLDMVLKDYEKDNGPIVVDDSIEEKIELDDSVENNSSSEVICISPTPSVKKDFKNSKILVAQANK